MNETANDSIDTLLHQQFDGPVPDAGFSQCVMDRLPKRRRRLTWPLSLGVLAGIAACWVALLPSPVLQVGFRAWSGGQWSAPLVVVLIAAVGMAGLAAVWGIAEANEG
ncbi:MAG TPA: hypothetical protein VF264_04570 [Rhodanobacteraceae bacterium]